MTQERPLVLVHCDCAGYDDVHYKLMPEPAVPVSKLKELQDYWRNDPFTCDHDYELDSIIREAEGE